MATLQSATLGQGMQLLKLVDDKGLSLDELQRRINSGVISDVFDPTVNWGNVDRDTVRVALGLAKLIPDRVVPEPTGIEVSTNLEVYPTTFVPQLTWRQRIERCNFNWVDQDVWTYIEQFSAIEDEDPAAIDVLLRHFGKRMSSDEAEQGLATDELQPLSPARFLHLCEQHPKLQLQFPLVCTKKICTDRDRDDRVLCAGQDDDGWRGLYLVYRNGDLLCRFPGFRKVKLSDA